MPTVCILSNGSCVNKELIVDSTAQEVVIALVEDKQLVELHREEQTREIAATKKPCFTLFIPKLSQAFCGFSYPRLGAICNMRAGLLGFLSCPVLHSRQAQRKSHTGLHKVIN